MPLAQDCVRLLVVCWSDMQFEQVNWVAQQLFCCTKLDPLQLFFFQMDCNLFINNTVHLGI